MSRVSHSLIKILVRNPLSYKFLKPLIELLNINEKEPYRIWLRFLIDNFDEAFGKKKNLVVWMNSMTPPEIVYSLGAIPFMPEVIASIVSFLGLSERYISFAEGKISTDVCSFHRCILGLVSEDILPKPKVILTSSNICDGSNKFYHYLSQIYKCPHIFIDVPYDGDTESFIYLSKQIERVFKDLSEILSVKVDKSSVYKTLSSSNLVRSLINDINQMRRNIPSPFPGSEGLSYLVGMNFWSHGSRRAIEFYVSLKNYIKNTIDDKERNISDKERLRILWLHQTRPYYKNDIFEILKKHKATVSFEEANYLYWPEMNPDKPIESISKKILSNIWQGQIERRLNAIMEMIEDYSIDGVIQFLPWGCRQGCGGASIVGEILRQKGVPFLLLPGDGIDPTNYSSGQTRTRLEAFLEMI